MHFGLGGKGEIADNGSVELGGGKAAWELGFSGTSAARPEQM